MSHDPLCPVEYKTLDGMLFVGRNVPIQAEVSETCQCKLIDKVRNDERRKN